MAKTQTALRIFQGLLAVGLIGMLAACSGGGGDGGGSGITYTGVTTPAVVTTSNADPIATTAYQAGDMGATFNVLGIVSESGGERPSHFRWLLLARSLEATARHLSLSGPPSRVAIGATESLTIDGGCGGTISMTASVNDQTGAFTAQMVLSNYCEDGVVMSGRTSMTGQFDLDAGTFLDLSMTLTTLTVQAGSDTFSASGTMTMAFGSSDDIQLDLVLRDASGEVYWARDYVIGVTPGAGYDDITMTGTFYHPAYGSVAVATQTSLRINSTDDWPSSGVLVMTGNSSGVKLTMLSATSFQLEVDVDGDFTYETDLGATDWASI